MFQGESFFRSSYALILMAKLISFQSLVDGRPNRGDRRCDICCKRTTGGGWGVGILGRAPWSTLVSTRVVHCHTASSSETALGGMGTAALPPEGSKRPSIGLPSGGVRIIVSEDEEDSSPCWPECARCEAPPGYVLRASPKHSESSFAYNFTNSPLRACRAKGIIFLASPGSICELVKASLNEARNTSLLHAPKPSTPRSLALAHSFSNNAVELKKSASWGAPVSSSGSIDNPSHRTETPGTPECFCITLIASLIARSNSHTKSSRLILRSSAEYDDAPNCGSAAIAFCVASTMRCIMDFAFLGNIAGRCATVSFRISLIKLSSYWVRMRLSGLPQSPHVYYQSKPWAAADPMDTDLSFLSFLKVYRTCVAHLERQVRSAEARTASGPFVRRCSGKPKIGWRQRISHGWYFTLRPERGRRTGP
jgi:hypothetical protein